MIANQGADPDALFFITEGSAAMVRRMAFDGSEKRLEKKYRGTMCCETEVSSWVALKLEVQHVLACLRIAQSVHRHHCLAFLISALYVCLRLV